MVYQINILMYVFSLILLILLESTFLPGENSSEQKALKSVFHFVYLLFLSKIAWNFFDGRELNGGIIINYIICNISAILTSVCGYKWFCYYERLTNPKKTFSILYKILILIPLVCFVAIIGTTFITKWIFYIDDNNFFELGSQPWLFITTSNFYLVLVIFCALFSLRKKVSMAEKKRYLIIGCFSFIPVLTLIYKIFDHTNLTIVQLGIVLALTCVYVNIQQQKITRDALTNLNNRVSFEKYLDGTITNYPENREPISLIFIDLLNFRKINNTFGHTEGDIVICNVAEVLKKLCSSKKCFLARYNGDVFAIVTKNILSSEVSEFEDSIKTEIEKIQTKKDIKLTPLICHKYYDVQMKNTKELIQKTLSIISEEKNLKNLTNKKTK